MKKILVIPDSHAHPAHNNDRFTALGNFILATQPDEIVDIGDSADMPSLCKYDVGTVRGEGARIVDDLLAYKDAQTKLWSAVNAHNKRMARNKKAQYKPYKVKCLGNHEDRIARAANEDPKMHGLLTEHLLNEWTYYDMVFNFLEPYITNGICFSHYFTSGVMGRPIGGIHHAASLVNKAHMSCVCGHSHTRDYYESCRPDGSRLFGLVVGSYVDYKPDWTKEHNRWWNGVVMLHEVHNGFAEPEFISIERIKSEYM